MSQTQTIESFKYAFMVVSLIGFVCCLNRADYNVALGIFAYLLWDQFHFPQKHRILWVMFISVIGDLVWILAVSVVGWNQQPIASYGLRTLTQVASIINMVYKIVLIGFAACKYEQCSDLFSWSSFKLKVLYL